MPNAINPDDYNIDNLNTGFLGPILTTDFREYVLGHNLQDINPLVVGGGYNLGGLNLYAGDLGLPNQNVQDLPDVSGMSDTPLPFLNNLSPWESNQVMNLHFGYNPYSYTIGSNTIQTAAPVQGRQSFEVTSKKLEDPGDTTVWKTPSGGEETAGNVREKMINSRSQFSENAYGPDYIYAYNCPSVPPEETGFQQYKTFAGGDFRSTILGQQLGFGAGAGIEYDSDLAEIGKDQRKFNVKERIKLNFVSDTLGKINADPFGLLAGQDLITRDYTITQAPGFGGKALEFTQSLIGFNIPTSILPSWKSTPGAEGDDISTDLLDFTAGGTKTLLFNAIELNKWGPNFVGNEKPSKEKSKVGKFIEKLDNALDQLGGSGTPPGTLKYTDNITTTTQIEDSREGSGDSLVEQLNNGVKKVVDGLIAGQEDPTIPTEFTNPSSTVDHQEGTVRGYNQLDTTYDNEVTMMDSGGFPTPAVTMNLDNMSEITHRETRDAGKHFWSDNGTQNSFKRGLLKYTQDMVNKETGVKGTGFRYVGAANSKQFINAENGKHIAEMGFSMGNRVTAGEGADKVYCRSWTMKNPYSRYNDTLRHRLSKSDILQNYSVLEDNGMPKVVPYAYEYDNWKKGLHTDASPSKYMLSIENLAWQNTREFNALPNIEKGPHGGRLMWFPPYDINFTDNSSVNWESTQFIGRGEPIYTYNNTERTGTLSFTIITDHPSSLNAIRNDVKGSLERYFAGCEDLGETAFGDLTNDEEIIEPDTAQVPKPMDPPSGPTPTLSFYFQNAKTTANPGRDIQTDLDASYLIDVSNPGNSTFEADTQAMVDFLLTQQGKRYRIISEGFTSALNVSSYNEVLGKDRATSLKNWLQSKLIENDKSVKWPNGVEGNEKTFPLESQWVDDPLRWSGPTSKGEVSGSGQDTPLTGKETPEQLEAIINDPKAVKGRRATIRLEYDPKGIDAFMDDKVASRAEEINKERQAEYNRLQQQREDKFDAISEKLANEMVNECTYFNKLSVEDPFLYDGIKDKVEFFHPAFHSMTPEGMNGRLNFLKQCTRQGPNINRKEPQNMAFGKPPICVLRIGDFYHTKIVIDTVNFTFDPLQWDLNPEGVGVQPMLAKVDLNFKFIGGSSLGGPINQLQNAVSFNFFANTSVYNRRKEVTTVDKEGLFGRKDSKGNPIKEETFGYGAFISPSQASGDIKKGEEIGEITVDLTKPDDGDGTLGAGGLDRDKLEDNITDSVSNETNKKVEEADFEEEAKKGTDPINWVNIGQQYGTGAIANKTTASVKDEEKDNWDIIAFEVYEDTCSEGDRNLSDGIASDKKSATYNGFIDDIEFGCDGESGTYAYTFKVTVNNTNDSSKQTFSTNKVINNV